MEDGIGIVMRRPTEESNKLFRMFQPFSGYVWLAIGGSVILIGLGLCFLNRQSLRRSDSEVNGRDGWKYGFKESLWLIFASLMEQGNTHRWLYFTCWHLLYSLLFQAFRKYFDTYFPECHFLSISFPLTVCKVTCVFLSTCSWIQIRFYEVVIERDILVRKSIIVG